MKRKKKIILISLIFMLSTSLLSGCAADEDDQVFVYGDTTFNLENDEADVNPHRGYSGWACIRYGIGETLFQYSDTMDVQPWLASEYDRIDELTWQITLRDDVYYTSGRKMDAQSVKECLEHLIEVHERAANDLKIENLAVIDTYQLRITTKQPVPALINYLSDPYGCIIDMEAGISEDGNVAGTGPYQAVEINTDQGLILERNENYYEGMPSIRKIEVKTISDGDTLTMALQSGELDGAYGLPYASLPLFTEEKGYKISSCETSRTIFLQMNFQSEIMQDERIRQAIACATDKENMTDVLLAKQATAALGPFPADFFDQTDLKSEAFDLETASSLLAMAGWEDSDGDGYVDQNGEKLTLRYLTYPSRQELPLLAESMQATLKEIGIELLITNTASYQDILDKGQWDIFAGAFVSAPTGDLEYFFTTHCLKGSSKNRGHYESQELETLAQQMAMSFDEKERTKTALAMTQTILNDHAFVFIAHLKMSLVYKDSVSGLTAHPSDYYEITAKLSKKQIR